MDHNFCTNVAKQGGGGEGLICRALAHSKGFQNIWCVCKGASRLSNISYVVGVEDVTEGQRCLAGDCNSGTDAMSATRTRLQSACLCTLHLPETLHHARLEYGRTKLEARHTNECLRWMAWHQCRWGLGWEFVGVVFFASVAIFWVHFMPRIIQVVVQGMWLSTEHITCSLCMPLPWWTLIVVVQVQCQQNRFTSMLITICIQRPFANGESPHAIFWAKSPYAHGEFPYANRDSPCAYGDVFFDQLLLPSESRIREPPCHPFLCLRSCASWPVWWKKCLFLLKKTPSLPNASGRPTTRRDYEKALEAVKLVTENVKREPLKAFGKHEPRNISGMRALFV